MLTHQLREQGFAEAAIVAAWATVDSGAVPVIGALGPAFQASPAAEGGLGPPRPPSFTQRPLFWATLVGWAVLSYAVPLLAAAWQGEGAGTCLLLQAGGIIVGGLVRDRNPTAAFGLLGGMVLALSALPLMLILFASLAFVIPAR
jgi:hypothetical protein